MLFSPAVGTLFLPAVGPLFCHPSRCSGPQASSPARRQFSVHVRASGFLSPASSSLVVFASRAALPSRSCNATLLSQVLLLRSSWHSMSRRAMALHGSPASLHASPCFDKLFARPRADPRVLFLTILQSSAALARRCAGWFAGLTSTTCVPSSHLSVEVTVSSPPRSLVILLW